MLIDYFPLKNNLKSFKGTSLKNYEMSEELNYIKIYATKSLDKLEKINYFSEIYLEYGSYSLEYLCSEKEKIGRSLLEILKKSETRTKKSLHLIFDTKTLDFNELKEIKKYIEEEIKNKIPKKFSGGKIKLEKKV